MPVETVRRPAMGGTMNDIYITLSGNVIAEPRQFAGDNGLRATSLRLASTPRLYDRSSRSWYDGETTYYTVRCYRVLAENVARCVRPGQPIVVHGRLRVRSFERDGRRGAVPEVEAISVGHDLRRGVSTFEKSQRTAAGAGAPVTAAAGVPETTGGDLQAPPASGPADEAPPGEVIEAAGRLAA
ncbi:single-stranded DNA-binding protein [Sphaerisporangium album]|uniref:Single-stranded DNA-binding protein n=1 Tax=Sphaerisporangium album TaxID=509200 RepID=A0A367F189_9ACTN|nr:single-stranded DNA-binding protein [Sphaerisporangium album]RCG23427.1 single-stranded DNA-binding protein [Sphaerisporangium album]